MSIKAIGTFYKNYHFRSRLEARWAVFFDALGLEWQYEPEGFDLGDGVYYLPDFRVTTVDGFVRWYEVKGDNVIDCEKFKKFKSLLFSGGVAADAVMLSGDPHTYILENANESVGVCPRCGCVGEMSYGIFKNPSSVDFGCFPCDPYTPGGSGNSLIEGIVCKSYPHKGALCVENDTYLTTYTLKINKAVKAARSARFEHGEKP